MARKTGLRGLQEWAKHVTQGYRDVEVTNMTTSFKSGLAFCAIIHRYRPELIPYDELQKENVLSNNQLAFSVAESELDIPALLDAEDMVALAVPDKLSIATYLSQYYNYFKNATPATSSQAAKISTISAPSPKRTKLQPVKTVSSPSLAHVGKENTPQVNPPGKPVASVKTNSTEPTTTSAPYRGRKSKFGKPDNKIPEGGGTLKRGTMGREECEVCGERVFLMERLSVESRVFHRSCFKCSTCLVALKPGSYELDSNTNKFYCQQHYREAIRNATIKRTMAERGLSPTDDAPIKPKRSKKFKNKPVPPPDSPPSPTEPAEMKTGLPSLLKTLAANKQQREATKTANPLPQPTPAPKSSSTVPVKPSPPITSIPTKPQPPVVIVKATHKPTEPKQTIVKPSEVKSTVGKITVVTSTTANKVSDTKPVNSSVKSATTVLKPAEPVTKPAEPVTKPVPKSVVSTTKAADPILKPSDPVKKHLESKLAGPMKQPVSPVTRHVDPVKKPVSSVTKPADSVKKPVEQVFKSVPKSTDPVTKPVEPAKVPGAESPVPPKPPRGSKSKQSFKRGGSIKPTRPAPPRPSQPPKKQDRSAEAIKEKRHRRMKALKRELDSVERKQEQMEERGVELEQKLRQREVEVEDGLVEEWFDLVSEKTLLARHESDLVYELKDLELIEQHEALDAEIRRRLTKDDSLKSPVERLEEEAMIAELVELVERRDKLLWTLHLEKTMDDEGDRQAELMASTQVPQGKPVLKTNKSMFL